MVVLLAKHPSVDNYDTSSVTSILCGAAPLQKETTEDVKKRLNITDVRQGIIVIKLPQMLDRVKLLENLHQCLKQSTPFSIV